jgi:hypothetical protein
MVARSLAVAVTNKLLDANPLCDGAIAPNPLLTERLLAISRPATKPKHDGNDNVPTETTSGARVSDRNGRARLLKAKLMGRGGVRLVLLLLHAASFLRTCTIPGCTVYVIYSASTPLPVLYSKE